MASGMGTRNGEALYVLSRKSWPRTLKDMRMYSSAPTTARISMDEKEAET